METFGLVTATSDGTPIVFGANDTKPVGGATTLGTATADFDGCIISADLQSTQESHAFDVIYDSTIVAPNLLIKIRPLAQGQAHFLIPKSGTSGQAIKVHGQTEGTGDRTANMVVTLLTGGTTYVGDQSAVSSYGFSSGTTQGVTLDPGGVANTESANTEITASLNEDTDVLIVQVWKAGDTSVNTKQSAIVKLYTGGIGSEVYAGFGAVYEMSIINDYVNVNPFFLPVDRSVFASGTRVSATIQSTSTTAGDRELMMALTGIQRAAISSGASRRKRMQTVS